MTVATKLSEARKLIERGWCRHVLARRGHVCALGAINMVANGDPFDWESSPLRDEMVGAVTQAIGTGRIGIWNNKQKSKKPVIEAFKRAEQLARDSAE